MINIDLVADQFEIMIKIATSCKYAEDLHVRVCDGVYRSKKLN